MSVADSITSSKQFEGDTDLRVSLGPVRGVQEKRRRMMMMMMLMMMILMMMMLMMMMTMMMMMIMMMLARGWRPHGGKRAQR